MIEKIDIQELVACAEAAGVKILEIYAQDFEVIKKDDESPLTAADREGNQVILDYLTKKYPDIPFISEESKATAYEDRKDWDYFWLIDPLDGTKEFVKKNGEFTVNIALVNKGEPVIGVVHVPVQKKSFYAIKDKGCFLSENGEEAVSLKQSLNYRKDKKITVVASRSHLSDDVKAFVADLEKEGKEVEFVSAGSSLKFCLLAEGKAHVYPRLGPTMEWDTGAAHVVAKESGFQVLRADNGEELTYNKENLLNPFFIVG